MGLSVSGTSGWQRYDNETVTSQDGAVDHAASAAANLRQVGDSAVGALQGMGQALAGRVVVADGDVRVDGVGEYLLNLGMAAGVAGIAPFAMVKDTVDAALHGIGAGFQAIF